jgi:hypothetical protein
MRILAGAGPGDCSTRRAAIPAPASVVIHVVRKEALLGPVPPRDSWLHP